MQSMDITLFLRFNHMIKVEEMFSSVFTCMPMMAAVLLVLLNESLMCANPQSMAHGNSTSL